MKNMTLRIVALASLLASLSFAPAAMGQHVGGGMDASVSTIAAGSADAWGKVGDTVSNGADLLGKLSDILKGILTDRKNAGTLVEKVSEALAKIPGMPSGRILQAQILKGLGKAAGMIDGIATSISSIFKVTDAAFSGDKEKYKEEVANYIITMTGKIVGIAVGDAVVATITAGTAGMGALPAAGIGILAGSGADAATKFLLETFAKDAIKNLVGRYYDWATGSGGENSGGSGSDDPFDSAPENDGGGQVGTAPGAGGQGGSAGGGTGKSNTRRRGGSGGGDTSARLW